MTWVELLAGGASVFLAALLGGVTGFGYALVATPLLLLLDFGLPFVVTANLALSMVTRVSVTYRFRSDIWPRRAALLVGGSVPGLWLGTQVLGGIDERVLKLGAGVVVMITAAALLRSVNAPPPRPLPGAGAVAGFAGGFLGATTSLNGVAPVLLLARDRAAPRAFIADLAVYFVVSNAIGLVLLALHGSLEREALFPAALLWLPASLAGNWIGTVLGPRVPERGFQRLVLTIVFAAGAVTTLTA